LILTAKASLSATFSEAFQLPFIDGKSYFCAMSNVLSAILFYLVIKPVSLLPFPLLYALSDFLFLVFYYIFPYRKKVVVRNLRSAFPDKSDEEIRVITKRFYRHFCDVIVETLKLFSASSKSIARRVNIKNPQLLEEYYENGKSLILVTGHYANWEWPAVTLPFHSRHKGTGIYQRLSNKFFDKKLRQTRARFGMELMSTREVADFFESHRNEICAYGFINDQSPSDPKKGHWATFLNQPTCMLVGAEKYAVKYDYPVLYGAITKQKRGQYSIEYIPVSDFPSAEKKYFITEECSRINEKLILSDPAYWLWTHRRWKHKVPAFSDEVTQPL
jgi:Kdo2-lipid IVA lauroyltransferase/acyltransferase